MLQGDGGVTETHAFTLPARCARAPSLKGGPEEGERLCTPLHGSRFNGDRRVRRCPGFRDPSSDLRRRLLSVVCRLLSI